MTGPEAQLTPQKPLWSERPHHLRHLRRQCLHQVAGRPVQPPAMCQSPRGQRSECLVGTTSDYT
eukprot:CAMPEP_0182613738 /NCGR_PEP_ID=MMETSP1330-20130603/26978_1 /TAXON_ID=464278 /ORGANISM="Picochlorum sp., Strain RCC944" /LENGTH=63 /DNA_ID=CAMNT_0024833487 /DNA_START=76 /DNA_END=263 /DNA_ORIENTATION=-